MASHKLGRNCSINRNTGTYAVPVWSPMILVKDATFNLDATEADASVRGSGGYALTVATLLNASIEFEIVEDVADANWIAMSAAFNGATTLECTVLNGPASVAGNTGLRAHWAILTFNRNEQLTGLVTRNVTMKPAWPADGNFPVPFTSV